MSGKKSGKREEGRTGFKEIRGLMSDEEENREELWCSILYVAFRYPGNSDAKDGGKVSDLT